MPAKHPKRPRDLNQWAKHIVDLVSGDVKEPEVPAESAAVAMGRRGGLKGGRARAASMTAKERSAAAKKAATARWNKKKTENS